MAAPLPLYQAGSNLNIIAKMSNPLLSRRDRACEAYGWIQYHRAHHQRTADLLSDIQEVFDAATEQNVWDPSLPKKEGYPNSCYMDKARNEITQLNTEINTGAIIERISSARRVLQFN